MSLWTKLPQRQTLEMSCIRFWVKILVRQITVDLGSIKTVKSEFLVCPNVKSKGPVLTERIKISRSYEQKNVLSAKFLSAVSNLR